MDRMSICGEKREKYNNKHGTPYDVLQSTTMGAVLRIMERCHRKKRNYILDQANIYVNGHSKKMGPFEGFHRRAVVFVPSEEEYELRKEKKVSFVIYLTCKSAVDPKHPFRFQLCFIVEICVLVF